MSTAHDLSDGVRALHDPVTPPAGGHRGRAVAALLVLALAAAGIAVAMGRGHSADHAAAPGSPIALPATLTGMPALPVTSDPLKGSAWQSRAHDALGPTVFAATTYGPAGSRRTVRAVAARGDLTGKLEQAWAADGGTRLGAARCTQNVRLVANGRAGVRPTLALCWRTSAQLSAYVVLIDPVQDVTLVEGAAALDAVWTAVS